MADELVGLMAAYWVEKMVARKVGSKALMRVEMRAAMRAAKWVVLMD